MRPNEYRCRQGWQGHAVVGAVLLIVPQGKEDRVGEQDREQREPELGARSQAGADRCGAGQRKTRAFHTTVASALVTGFEDWQIFEGLLISFTASSRRET